VSVCVCVCVVVVVVCCCCCRISFVRSEEDGSGRCGFSITFPNQKRTLSLFCLSVAQRKGNLCVLVVCCLLFVVCLLFVLTMF
jgi:hypothetical protein